MNDRLRNLTIWVLLALFALFNALKPLMPGTPWEKVLPAVSILSMLGFVLLHGPRQIGWRRLAVFFVISFVVSWSYESLSIATGFPFGHYYYTDNMGPKFGTVPLLIMPAYYAVCYVSWHLGQLVLDRFDECADGVQTWLVPPLAALIMVMWDMSMDPARSTLSGAWIWQNGGGYFGVPFVNFLGWLLCVWTIFQLYALYLRCRPPADGVIGTTQDRREYWHQMTALYGALFLEFIAFALFPPKGTATDKAGVLWNVKDMYETLGLVAIFSMVFVTLLTFIKVQLSVRLRAP
jgi:uncharacterized membrane protein